MGTRTFSLSSSFNFCESRTPITLIRMLGRQVFLACVVLLEGGWAAGLVAEVLSLSLHGVQSG